MGTKTVSNAALVLNMLVEQYPEVSGLAKAVAAVNALAIHEPENFLEAAIVPAGGE